MKNPFAKNEPKKDETKKKRGQYQKRECPYCKKHFGNLENHIKLAHPTEAEQRGGGDVETPQITSESLLSGEKPQGEKKPDTVVYFCTGCKAKLRKGETPCWNCGQVMVWEGVE